VNDVTRCRQRYNCLLSVLFKLFVPALLFLFAIVSVFIFHSLETGNNPELVSKKIQASGSVILLLSQFFMLIYFLWLKKADHLEYKDLGWQRDSGKNFYKNIMYGSISGIVIALLYIFLISDAIVLLQRKIGDYVSPGELFSAIGSDISIFFLANVVFAPFVEENIFRGFADFELRKYFSVPVRVLISCFYFGMLHWAGGFWYILATGIIAGTLFHGLFIFTRTIYASFAAHLVLNSIEFIYVISKL